jgi:ankyrin repeat protein
MFPMSLFAFSHLFLFAQAWAPGNIFGDVSNLGSLSRLWLAPLPASCSAQFFVLRRSKIPGGKSRLCSTVDSSPADLTSALFSAIIDPNATLVDVLLQQGANPTSFDDWGVSCLQLAVKNGEEEIVRSLVRAGVDVNMSDRDGDTTTPLHMAAQRGYLGIVQVLVKNGAGGRKRSSSFMIKISSP